MRLLLPIRMRIAAASTVVALVLIGGAGLLFLTTLRSGLEDSVDSTLRSSASELRSQVASAGGSAATIAASRIQLADNTYGQVFSADGAVLASTNDRFAAPLLTPAQVVAAEAGDRFVNVTLPREGKPRQTQDERVLAVRVGADGLVVAVASNRDTVDDAVDRAGKQLLVLGAVVLVAAALGSWLLARAALRPVERMRAQAAELEARDAGGGLDVPTSHDEIGRLGATLNALLARLHSALQRERDFVADAGHELRTPLTVLRGELELARKPGRTREELMETVEVASQETERLITLAEDLLVLARDEHGAEVRWTAFDLSQLVGEATGRLTSAAAARSVRLVVSAPDQLPVQGDPARIRQAVDNVLANALRHAPEASAVTISASAEAVSAPGSVPVEFATVEVTDEGPGFSPDLLPIAFERFRREDKARTRRGAEVGSSSAGPGSADSGLEAGSGLGLAIVRTVMRGHGGEAEVFNRQDARGARVLLSWPARRAGPAPAEFANADLGKADLGNADLGKAELGKEGGG